MEQRGEERLLGTLRLVGLSMPPLERRVAAPATWIALLTAAALAWVLTVRSASGMAPGPGTMGRDLPGFVALWVLMMAAVMLPSVAPTVGLYLHTVRARSTGRTRAIRSAGLVAGYLLVWAAFGVLAFAAARAGSHLAARAPQTAAWVGAVLLAGAGTYQLTPLKDRCLRHCRSPLGFLVHVGGYRGRFRDLRVGLYHGAYCVGCCWGLMLVLVIVGVMNLAWMAALAAVVFLEKTWRHGKAFSVVVGVALIVFACFVPWNHALIPGLHMTGMTM
jgi:predicted metal-binding membrane protein